MKYSVMVEDQLDSQKDKVESIIQKSTELFLLTADEYWMNKPRDVMDNISDIFSREIAKLDNFKECSVSIGSKNKESFEYTLNISVSFNNHHIYYFEARIKENRVVPSHSSF